MNKATTDKPTKFRYVILALLFIATTILYIDRSALGIMAPFIENEIGWTEHQYGLINSGFMIGYAICFLIMGTIIDKIGARMGYVLSIGLWSIAQVLHAFARSWVGFAFVRFGLAVGQSGNFPVAIKVVAEWFPKKERAFAVGLFNGGANMGTIIAPLVIPFIVAASSNNWRIAFLWTFPISLLWIILYLRFYKRPEEQPKANQKEVNYILSDVEKETTHKVGWKKILAHRGTYAIAIGKFIGDPIWWFYLFWGAKFLNGKFGLDLKEIGIPFFTIYLLSWLGGIFFGWLSSKFLKMGWSLNKGRKIGMLCCGIAALPVMFVPHTDNLWLAVGLIALAAGGHCGWSANIFSLMTDLFPKRATASVTGFGGFAGAIGGALAAYGVGRVLQNIGDGGYAIPFAVASVGYLFALLVIHILVPKLKPIEF